MLIAATLTIPAVGTGYTLKQLLDLALVRYPETYRVASVKLQIDPAATGSAYLVSGSGTIATTADVPDQYGYILSLVGDLYSTFLEESRQNTNTLSLDEICLAADVANTVVHLWAYTI